MRSRGLVVAFALACGGCLHDNLVDCGDGTSCPAGYTCTLASGCMSPAQIEACLGLIEGDACALEVLGNGTCQEGGCLIAVCGDGIRQGDEVCDDGNTFSGDGCSGTCTSSEQCGNGLVELDEECDCGDAEHPGPSRCMATVNGGALCSTTCRIRRCGDGEVGPGEACDDGNTTPGDGCSFDCASAEVCGNGVVDFFAGEQCDDANDLSRDGCSRTCVAEPLSWRLEEQAVTPEGRGNAAIAYDAGRKRTVMFGGLANLIASDTWEHDGTAWVRRQPVVRPPSRYGAAMTYDSKRGRIVLFGGYNSQYFDDTWEYDGSTWAQRTLATSPPARQYSSMTFDSARGVTVLFGGLDAAGQLADVWELDATGWHPRTFAISPSARHGATLTYDPVRGRAVLFGGASSPVGAVDETWEYDGVTWAMRAPAQSPPARLLAGAAYDTARRRIVIYGGANGGPLGDVWEYDGTTWTSVSTGAPPARTNLAMTYDTWRERLLVFGGSTNTVSQVDETWERDGTTWTAWQPGPEWSTRNGSAVAYDAGRGVTVLFGGARGSTIFGDMWERTGSAWIERTPAARPSGRSQAAMTYFASKRRVVLFGGFSLANGTLDDTWEYPGSAGPTGPSWSLRGPTTIPAKRSAAAMTYDPIRNRAVMFGGANPITGVLGDTWEYDGTNWTQPTLSGAVPPARAAAAIAFDQRRGVTVLFGGRGLGTTLFGDVWEYDGMAWTPRTFTVMPIARAGAMMTYDPLRARILLYGGDAVGSFEDTWEYDGTTWTRRNLSTPPARSLAGFVFDAAAGRALLVGGGTTETWSYGYEPVAPIEVCSLAADEDADAALGCADPDCWGVCTPMCAPGQTTCAMAPRCGDAICGDVEDCRSCPADCPTGTALCPIRCGDFHCDSGETATTCPGDCP